MRRLPGWHLLLPQRERPGSFVNRLICDGTAERTVLRATDIVFRDPFMYAELLRASRRIPPDPQVTRRGPVGNRYERTTDWRSR
jgi:hypothetical protein